MKKIISVHSTIRDNHTTHNVHANKKHNNYQSQTHPWYLTHSNTNIHGFDPYVYQSCPKLQSYTFLQSRPFIFNSTTSTCGCTWGICGPDHILKPSAAFALIPAISHTLLGCHVLWGRSIDIMNFIMYNLYIVFPNHHRTIMHILHFQISII